MGKRRAGGDPGTGRGRSGGAGIGTGRSDALGTRSNAADRAAVGGVWSEAAASGTGVRVVQPPRLFDKAFRDASAARHAADIAKLTQAFIDLGPDVDPREAARAARVVYTYVDQLVVEYEIEDSPLIHNSKVNFGQKPRGLCWHWAVDLDIRLQMERFRTLEIHRAIANYNNIRLEHSTTLLGRRGGEMKDAIVLDPWRKGGVLTWMAAREDTRYNWTPRDEVFAYKRRMQESQGDTEGRATERFDR
ncbi:MAG: hypothetical protein M5U35_09110 [Roseovarius sp.]|nr:hypothetical protein [Roseovarius sp.]